MEKCEIVKSRKQKIFILNIELSEEKWEKLPEFKIMPKIEHKNVFPPAFKKIENNFKPKNLYDRFNNYRSTNYNSLGLGRD